jgi:hypothetical protein
MQFLYRDRVIPASDHPHAHGEMTTLPQDDPEIAAFAREVMTANPGTKGVALTNAINARFGLQLSQWTVRKRWHKPLRTELGRSHRRKSTVSGRVAPTEPIRYVLEKTREGYAVEVKATFFSAGDALAFIALACQEEEAD